MPKSFQQSPIYLRLMAAWLLFMLAFALPELYVHWQYAAWINQKSVGKILVFVVLGSLCVLTLHNKLGRIIALLLWLMQGSQVMHHQFFQRFYNGADVSLAFVEAQDISQAMLGMWRLSLPVLAISFISITLLLLAMGLAKKNRVGKPAAIIMLILLSAHIANHAHKSIWKSEPGFAQLAVHNGLNSVVTYIAHFAFSETLPTEQYIPYSVKPLPSDFTPNVIFIIGESINPHHLGVLGFKRNTTPQLTQLMQNYPSQKRIIYSAGVTTRVSTPMLLVVNREPKHIARYKTQIGQLVSQAKVAGYHTELYSSQTLDFMPGVSAMADYDVFQDRAQNVTLSDEAMVATLQKISVVKAPRFIMLNIRSPHMPYAEHITTAQFSTQKTGDNITDTRNEYDDALLTTDSIIANSIKTLLKNDPRPTYIVLTSDHGEVLGEGGRFGHNRLALNDAEVPLLTMAAYWPEDKPMPVAQCVNNHYQLGKLLLQVIGFELVNPNDDGKTYFINGNSLYGNNGELSYTVSSCQQSE